MSEMKTIHSLEELEELAEVLREEQKSKSRITVCTGVACSSLGSEELAKELSEESKNLENCEVKKVGCKGLCALGVLVEDDKNMYHSLKKDDAKNLLAMMEGTQESSEYILSKDIPFYSKQKKIVLENAGYIDPDSLDDYIAADGYKALFSAISDMERSEVIDEIKKSGLRGRGGGGYPTGLKWSTVEKAIGDQKYVICNADEGDPGAFMDRSVMEADPHRVIEGMAIAAYAVGANKGYLYIRAEYPLAVKRIKLAIKRAEKFGLLGENICGSGFSLKLDVRLGAGAFVCGEETALLSSIEGKRGTPTPRPPYPAESGLWGKPTLINNVETYANIAPIIRNGGDWYAKIGTESSKGTKVFALTGQIKNSGMIEVPMGITLEQIIFEIGGGMALGREFKAVQTGGPSGGCIPRDHLNLEVDYENLKSVGSMMGSGGMIVMDESSKMVEVAKFFMEFCMSESCGKCVPCRVGTVQMYEILKKISKKDGTRKDLALLEELCDVVRNTSLCGLGQSAPNPVVSTLRFFKEEYENLLVESRCHISISKEA